MVTTARQRPKRASLPDAKTLFDESAAGIAISGDSGTGKSSLMLLLMLHLIRAGIGLTLIDPHGDLATDLERHCAALPERIRRRLVVVRYSDTDRIVGMNPLSIGRFLGNALTWPPGSSARWATSAESSSTPGAKEILTRNPCFSNGPRGSSPCWPAWA